MKYDLNNMNNWEKQKALFLTITADELGMDLNGYGALAVNQNSGYTYLWLEDYSFTLYMPINCELKKEDVYALWINFENGEEVEMRLEQDTTLEDLENWVDKLMEQEKDEN